MIQHTYDDESVKISFTVEVTKEVAVISTILPLQLEGQLGMNVN